MGSDCKTPVLLLKTRSTPSDAYEELFSKPVDGFESEPVFVPVLEHKFDEDGMARFQDLLKQNRIGRYTNCSYGGLIFTSQRAVEAFSKLVQVGGSGEAGWPHIHDVPVYSVGPATTRALKAISQEPPLNVVGEHTGNGDNLARFILEHYAEWYQDRPEKPPLLFLVGEQRRDIIPKTLMDANLPPDRIIQVDEITLYGTGVMGSFKNDFQLVLRETEARPTRWVVVFSPTGCRSMLEALQLLDPDGTKARDKPPSRSTYIATIGPTTRDYLQRTFQFEPDVCSEKPSPEGVRDGIIEFMKRLGK